MDNRTLYQLKRGVELLTVGNPKTMKGTGKGYATAILHLAPAWQSGYNTCPAHSKECAAACLNTSGRGAMANVQAARLRRTKLFFEDRPLFMQHLHLDIVRFSLNAERLGFVPVFRLNGTSDIRWERHGVPQKYPALQFYDYFKVPNRKGVPPNYHLTFSFSGNNLEACRQALANGMSVAVPFMKRPETWLGYPVVDGDDDDTRFLDAKGVVIALKPKGKLRKDLTSAFLGDNAAA